MTTPERPHPSYYFADASAKGEFASDDVRLTAYCQVCSTRLGFVLDTEHGLLWIGLLGTNRNSRRARGDFFASLGGAGDGRSPVPLWVEDWRRWYFACECKCGRGGADGTAVWAALQARRRKVEIPLPPPAN